LLLRRERNTFSDIYWYYIYGEFIHTKVSFQVFPLQNMVYYNIYQLLTQPSAWAEHPYSSL